MMETNFTYLYDGTWENLIELIFWLIKEKRKPLEIIEEEKYEPTLFNMPIKPIRNGNTKDMEKRMPRESLRIAYYVFLSNKKNKELIIYYFLLNSLKYQHQIIYMRNLKCVNEALNIQKRVSREAHKWKGFLRFKETKNHFLYAEFNADNNILGILAKHFQKRLPKEYWLIKDQTRDILCIYDQKNLHFLESKDLTINLKIEKEEIETEELWKTFFQTIAIKERLNRKCQQNFMPKKYWQNILEMEGTYEKSDYR